MDQGVMHAKLLLSRPVCKSLPFAEAMIRARVFHSLHSALHCLELDYTKLHVYTSGRNSNINSHQLLNPPPLPVYYSYTTLVPYRFYQVSN